MGRAERVAHDQALIDKIDDLLGGHDLQRSPEADASYIPRIHDGPLRYDDERENVEVWRVIADGRSSISGRDAPGRVPTELMFGGLRPGWWAPPLPDAEPSADAPSRPETLDRMVGISNPVGDGEWLQRALQAQAEAVVRQAREMRPTRMGGCRPSFVIEDEANGFETADEFRIPAIPGGYTVAVPRSNPLRDLFEVLDRRFAVFGEVLMVTGERLAATIASVGTSFAEIQRQAEEWRRTHGPVPAKRSKRRYGR